MDLEEINKQLEKLMHEQNNTGKADFEGYSPSEMHQILHLTFSPDSPLKLQKLSDSDYKRISLVQQIKYLANLIDRAGAIQLTKKGFLPVKVVADLYEQGFIKDEAIEKEISKLYKETDSISINLTRILIELSGLAKKRKGKLSLTKSSKKILSDDHELLRLILLTFTTKFNWAYYDGYGENQIGQLGYGFSLVLLSKFGNEKQLDSFYANKYFKAFPNLLTLVEPDYTSLEAYTNRCYSLRTFDRFLDYFGLIEIEGERILPGNNNYIKKTSLFDKLIECAPPKSQ